MVSENMAPERIDRSTMQSDLQQSVARQRQVLQNWLSSSLTQLAEDCLAVWPDREALERRLTEGLAELPYCKYLYVLDHKARQITANASHGGLLQEYYDRERNDRPYMKDALAGSLFSLSEAYISRNARRPTLTAVQRIEAPSGEFLGYLGADFDLRELPATQALYEQPGQWMQLKGDPAIRAGLFHQERIASPMDERIDEVLDLLNELITINGVFHAKLHFSSSRATVWLVDDPYRFRIHNIAELTDADICLAYPRHDYPSDALVPADRVREILQCFRDLRFMDETLYLRSGTLNIFNGIVGLTFSCDGSHYMPWEEFLDKSFDFWVGTPSETRN